MIEKKDTNFNYATAEILFFKERRCKDYYSLFGERIS